MSWMASDDDAPPRDFPGETVSLACSNVTERSLGFPLPLPLPAAVAAIRRAVERSDVLLLHDALYPTNWVAANAAANLQRPVLFIQHVGKVPYRNWLLSAAMSLANRVVAAPRLARADQVVFVSELTAAYFQRLTRFRRPPIVIFNGLRPDLCDMADMPDRVTARVELGLDPTRSMVLFVGRFVEKKGLEIIRRMAQAGASVQWVICGWGPVQPEGWGAPDVHVFRQPDARQLARAYRAADLLILPSVGEGLPLVIQEALAMGTHVLASTELADADPWLRGRISTAIVDHSDPARTAVIWRLAIESCRQSGLCRAGLEDETRRRYAWPEAARRYAQVLQELVSSANRSPAAPAPPVA